MNTEEWINSVEDEVRKATKRILNYAGKIVGFNDLVIPEMMDSLAEIRQLSLKSKGGDMEAFAKLKEYGVVLNEASV